MPYPKGMSDGKPGQVDLYGREIPAAAPEPEPEPEPEPLPVDEGPSGKFNFVSEKPKLGLMLPAGAYHFNHSGDHVHGLNERNNTGLGVTLQVSENTEAFAVAYRNSYANMARYRNDVTIMAGVNWDPLKVDMGPLHLKAGLMAGAATTLKGSYADMAPQLSKGNVTLVGGLHGEVMHKPSGIGVGVSVVPPVGKANGVAAFYLKKQF